MDDLDSVLLIAPGRRSEVEMFFGHCGARSSTDAAADQRAYNHPDRPAYEADDRAGPGAGRGTARGSVIGRMPASREAPKQQQ
jgi:hypothetical protein